MKRELILKYHDTRVYKHELAYLKATQGGDAWLADSNIEFYQEYLKRESILYIFRIIFN